MSNKNFIESGATKRTAAKINKTGQVLVLLRRKKGATIVELMQATDWLAHTVRAALSGLRKKGHVIERSKRGEVTCYRMVEAV